MSVTVTKRGPGLKVLQQQLKQIRESEVYVGIPAQNTLRKGDKINNATLMYLLTNGVPSRNIPPTPIVEPGIERARKPIGQHLGLAAKAVLDGRPADARRELHLAGTIASNSVKRMFTDNDWPPNAPSTIARKGSDRRNIDTGQLRRAVTFVVKSKGSVPPPPSAETKQYGEKMPGSATSGVERGAESVASEIGGGIEETFEL